MMHAFARFVAAVCVVATAAPLLALGGSIGPQPAPQTPAEAPAIIEADTFVFRDGGGRVVPVALVDEGGTRTFVWPEAAGSPWDTALLGVSLRAAADATTAHIEMAAAGRVVRQYVRPGDRGARWINVGELARTLTIGTPVTLSGRGVDLDVGPATLRLFASRLDLTRPMLVLAPHPDDAEIGAFGLWANRPRATIVTVTAGNAGPLNYEAVVEDPVEHYRIKGRLRVINSVTVPWIGGIPPERTFNMGYFDARLAEMHDNPMTVVPEMYAPNTDIGVYLQDNLGSLLPKRSRSSTWRNLVDDLDRILRRVKPAVIVAPHPQLDSHRDHQFTTIALAEAMARRRTRATLLLYTNHADLNRYPYGPAGTLMSLPPSLSRPTILDGVYSHPVSPAAQRLKLFALEAQHDLRASPSRLYQLILGEGRTESPEKIGPAATGGIGYLRRGPRANEIFYVYDERTVRPMLAAFLEAWRSRPVP